MNVKGPYEHSPELDKYHHASDLSMHLGAITSSLRLLGIMTLLMTLSNLGTLVGLVIDSSLIQQANQANSSNISQGLAEKQYLSYWWLVASLIVFALALLILGISDIQRRRGDAIFQEVSNTFQEIENEQTTDSRGLRGELMAAARIALRSFASSADPLLIRGRYGTGIYALVNIVIVLVAVILYSQAA
jgi:hypothetical protein